MLISEIEGLVMQNKKKGFTLIEMLVVIAIIAILVSIIVPVTSNANKKSKAAADAANLRTVLGMLNIEVINGQSTVPEIINASLHPTSQMDPEAVLQAVFDAPGFIEVYYVKGNVYYSLDYLSDVATNGESSISTAKPTVEGTWYQAGSPDPIS